MQKLQYKQELSPLEAAQIIGVSADTVRRWAKQRKIRFRRNPSGRILIPVTEVSSILREIEPETSENCNLLPPSDRPLPGLERV